MKASELKNLSLSHGTTRTQDLLPAFFSACMQIDELAAEMHQLRMLPFPYIPSCAQKDPDSNWWDSEEALYRLLKLEDLLDNVAPWGFYFGSHPGDASEYGFWERYWGANSKS